MGDTVGSNRPRPFKFSYFRADTPLDRDSQGELCLRLLRGVVLSRGWFLVALALLAPCLGFDFVGWSASVSPTVVAAESLSNERRPLSFAQILPATKLAFVGRVVGALENRGVKEVTVRIDELLVGEIDISKPVVFRQFGMFAPDVSEGERVVWYLPATTTSEMMSPVGITSGAFGVYVDDGLELAINGVGNLNFWGPTNSIWASYTEAEIRELLRQRGLAAKKVNRILKVVSEPGPVPLDLLVVLSKAKPPSTRVARPF